jgi:dipeptidase
MGNRQKLSHHEELTRQPVTMKNQFTEKKLLRPICLEYGGGLLLQ